MTHSRGSQLLALFVAFVFFFATHIAARAQPGYKYLEQSLGPSFVTLRTYTFDTGTQGWAACTFTGFSVPEYSWQDGKLAMEGTGSSILFGFWQTGDGDTLSSASCLYHIACEVSTDITARYLVPETRIRSGDAWYSAGDSLFVTSLGDGGFSPLTENCEYHLFFLPCPEAIGATQTLYWDIMNFCYEDDLRASLFLDSVRISAAPLDSLKTPTLVRVWDFQTGSEGWTSPDDAYPPHWTSFCFSPLPINPKAIATAASGSLRLRGGTLGAYGYWQSPFDVAIAPGKMYVADFELHTDEADPQSVPGIIISAMSENWQCVVHKWLICGLTGGGCIDSEGSVYSVYFVPSPDWIGAHIGFLFEMVAYGSGENMNATVYLDKVVVKSLDLLVMPTPTPYTAAKPTRWLLYE